MRLALALLFVHAACAQSIISARAGLIYYAFGEIEIDGQPMMEATDLKAGQRLAARDGRAEVLMGSGAMLWLDKDSVLHLVSNALDDVQITLESGQAILEIIDLPKEARIAITVRGETDAPTRSGVYPFTTGVEPSHEFFQWATFRSFQLFTHRDRGLRNWEVSRAGVARHKGFAVEFRSSAPFLQYAASYRAGLLTYAEGEAALAGTGGRRQRPPFFIAAGATLVTGEGRAEMFLGKGITLRAAPNSSVRLIEADALRPVVAVDRGSVLIEVAKTSENAKLRVELAGSISEPVKPGVYLFDTADASLRVYEGEVSARREDHTVAVKSSQRIDLAALSRPARFSTKDRGDFFDWCGLRSFALSSVTGELMGDWSPTTQRNILWHKLFGTRAYIESSVRDMTRRQGNLEASLRILLLRTPF